MDDPYERQGSVVATTITFGGAYTGVSYSGVLDGKIGATTYLPDGQYTLSATALFTVMLPSIDPVTQSPAIDGIHTEYAWFAKCARGVNHQVTPTRELFVPTDPRSPLFSIPGPTAVVTDTVTIPEGKGCFMLSVRSFMDPPEDPNRRTGSLGTMIDWFAPEPRHEFNPERAPNGDIVLYAIASDGELEEVERSGDLTMAAPNALRYYFASCPAARDFLAVVADPAAAAGVLRVPRAGEIAGQVLGATARAAGKPTFQVWGLKNGTEFAWNQAEVVVDGGDPAAGCL